MPNEAVAAGGHAAATASPTPFNVNVPQNGIYVTDPIGGGITIIKDGKLVQTGTQALGGLYLQSQGKTYGQNGRNDMSAGEEYLKSIGVDFHNLPQMSGGAVADMLGNAGKLGLSFSNVTDLAGLSSLLKNPGSGGGGTVTLNGPGSGAVPDPNAIAAAKAAQDKQLAGTQGKNVQTQTDAQGNIISSTPTPIGASTPQPLDSKLPGGDAKTLYDYYSAQGKTLPAIADRGNLFHQLGLGTAEEYKGSATQNEELLSALQRQDHATSTIGAPAGSKTAATNSTPAGTSLASALAGSDAATTIATYKTYLSTALGVAATTLSHDQASLSNFFSNEKDPSSILQDAMDSAGVAESRGVLAQLDKQISDQTAILNRLPDDIKSTLSDVGVSQAQLDRLVAKETKGPNAALKDLMASRNALSGEIDKAMSFAEKFANTKIAGQAARLAALEWQVNTDKSEFDTLDADAKSIVNAAIADKKDIMTTALTAAKNGASADVIDSILSSGSAAEAIQTAGPALVVPKKTPGTTPLTSDINAAASAFSVGIPDKGYNGVGPDGYVDNHLYANLYNQALATYGNAGAQAFLKAYPPTGGGKFTKGIKGVNPANIGTGVLPPAIENLLLAGQKTKKVTSIQ